MNNLVLDIYLFVSAVIQIFVSAQEELSKTDLSKAMITYLPKSVVQKQKNSLKNILYSIWIKLRREMKNLGDMIRFNRTMLSNLKPRRTKIQN